LTSLLFSLTSKEGDKRELAFCLLVELQTCLAVALIENKRSLWPLYSFLSLRKKETRENSLVKQECFFYIVDSIIDCYQLKFLCIPSEVFMQSLDACIFGRRQKSRYNRCCRICTSKKYQSLLLLHTRE
jgi:hypothetical protein